MKEEEQKIVQAFLSDLKALMIKYDASLGGCGCCGSPFVSIGPDINLDEVSADAGHAGHAGYRYFDQATKQWVKVSV